MKSIFLALALLSTQAVASNPPLSGTFSNASGEARDRTFNLVVVANERGQEFYLQCFKDGKTGFGTLTRLPKAKHNAVIRAGSSCPTTKIEVDLDYEEAYVRVGRERISLPRREIYVPIAD